MANDDLTPALWRAMLRARYGPDGPVPSDIALDAGRRMTKRPEVQAAHRTDKAGVGYEQARKDSDPHR